MAAQAQGHWECSLCTFVNPAAQSLCSMCASSRPIPPAVPTPSLSAQPPPAPPAIHQPQPPPMQPPMRITVRSFAHPRGWLLPFPQSYDELIESAHEHISTANEIGEQYALQLFVNRGRITAATFHLLRDRDVLDALYINTPPTCPSSPTTAISSHSTATTAAAVSTQAAPSRKRPAPDSESTFDTTPSPPNGTHDSRTAETVPPPARAHVQPPFAPAAASADSEMPPLSPDRRSSVSSSATTVVLATAPPRSSGRARMSRAEIVIDDGRDDTDMESKTAHYPSPKQEPPSSTAPAQPPPPPPPSQPTTTTIAITTVMSSHSSSPPSQAASLTSVIRSQLSLPYNSIMAIAAL